MYGLPSPTTMAWLIRAWLRSRSSSTAGATFLPPAVTMISFFRPVMVRNPSSSSSPRSPVRNQPSSVKASLVAVVVVPVAGEDDPAPDQDLAVLADLDRDAGQRLADRADLVPVRPVDGGGGRRLGQAVPLQHGDAHAAEEMAEPLGERGAAGDGVTGPAAERGPQLGVDQPVEQRVLGPQAEPGPARRVESLAVGDRGPGGPAEDRALLARWPPSARRRCRPSRTPAAPPG